MAKKKQIHPFDSCLVKSALSCPDLLSELVYLTSILYKPIQYYLAMRSISDSGEMAFASSQNRSFNGDIATFESRIFVE
jgi:hypothetical protein